MCVFSFLINYSSYMENNHFKDQMVFFGLVLVVMLAIMAYMLNN